MTALGRKGEECGPEQGGNRIDDDEADFPTPQQNVHPARQQALQDDHKRREKMEKKENERERDMEGFNRVDLLEKKAVGEGAEGRRGR